MTTFRVLVPAVAVFALAACNNGSSSPSAGSGAPAATTATTAAAAPAGAKKPNTTLTNQQLQDAYKAATKDMSLSADKQTAIVTAAIGKPTKVNGDTNLWYAWKPKDTTDPDCMELQISGSKGDSIGGSDWSNCGMAN